MKVNVLGFGLMAKQISALLSLGGFSVFIWNHQKAEIADLKRQIKIIKRATGLDGSGEVTLVEKLEDLEDNLTIESVIEDLDVKKSLFEKTRNNISNAYCTNSSSLAPGRVHVGQFQRWHTVGTDFEPASCKCREQTKRASSF